MRACKPVPKVRNMVQLQSPGYDPDKPLNVGNFVEFSCAPGFMKIGDITSRCIMPGIWTPIKGKCISKKLLQLVILLYVYINLVGISCKKPLVNSDTAVIGNSYLYMDKVNITCSKNETHRLVCGNNGTWQGDIGNC